VAALSLSGLRRKIEIALLPEEPHVVVQLDRAARHPSGCGRNRAEPQKGSRSLR
jgi:hypothetical protein